MREQWRLSEKQSRSIFKIFKNSSNLKLKGFHAHIGSQIVTSDSFVQLAKKMSTFYKEVQEK